MAEPSTPMMKQYSRIKKEHRDAILFFRLGDFYEMFQGDAQEASKILGLTLTARNGVPMCGIPYHASHNYISRLLASGKKIAICEQIQLPENGKGIAQREVVEVITPGTVVEEDILNAKDNNYIGSAALIPGKGGTKIFSFSVLDCSTGEFISTSFPGEDFMEGLKREMSRFRPRELIIQESLMEEHSSFGRFMLEQNHILLNRYPDWLFGLDSAKEKLLTLFGTANLKGFGFNDDDPEIVTAGILIEYVEDNVRSLLPHIRSLKKFKNNEIVEMDESTQRNLEIIGNMQDGSRHYSLISVLDQTKTAMGGRLLKKWLLSPLKSVKAIQERLDKVELLYRDQTMLNSIRERLTGILDLERLCARLAVDKAHGKDLLAIKTSLLDTAELGLSIKAWKYSEDFSLMNDKNEETCKTIINLLERGLAENPSVTLTEGNLIKEGFNHELDDLRTLKVNSKSVLSEYLEKEKKDTGIPSLKIKYNKIIGHFLEVTKTHLSSIPERFIRRQTLVGSERYTTERLSDLESQLNSASEKIIELEKILFLELRNQLKHKIDGILEVCDRIARIDSLQSFAYSATINGYSKPKVNSKGGLKIKDGRHPVVENYIHAGNFVPNDIDLDSENLFFALITGPNMAGKSTYLRQTALIVLMAQAGSFIPAQEAELGIVDKIFCRVGASDNLARGESTFLVEMNETANILRTATSESLIIMDEVGRGTSTNDGLAIAQSVSEYIAAILKSRTLFATHFHELTGMELPGMVNLSLSITEDNGEIIFLKRVIPGPSNNSYGIHVAKLAGLPNEVIVKAQSILAILVEREGNGKKVAQTKKETDNDPKQGTLFSDNDLIIQELRSLNPESTTPIEALNILARWKKIYTDTHQDTI
jgi:DNA mismatch repair protein MutS